MTKRLRTPARVGAIALAAGLATISAAPAASAAEGGGDVAVVNTETVQVYTDASGKVDSRRVYEQLSMTGRGSVSLANPIETDGLRNLDGFGGFDVEDGKQLTDVTVDGEQRLRSVSDYDGDLPLEFDIQYFLDGNRVEPGDVVGGNGELEVLYTVRNTTAENREVSFDDGKGGTVTKTVSVPIPIVGSLSTTVPASFTNVQSDQANIAGDGHGGTKLSFTMTLFPPLGSDTAEFGYTANITDGVVPRASVSALPVNPLESPTFKTAATSYQGGAATGVELTDGAAQIDENVLKLHDGAADLLAGLTQLHDGANELQAGLSGDAVPGADKLAAGASELDGGLGRLSSGARRLAEGSGELDAGAARLSDGLDSAGASAPQLVGGVATLRAGLVKVDSGLAQLSAGVGDISQNPDYKRLRAGIAELLDGVGTKGQVGSLTWAVDRVRAGLETEAVPGLDKLIGGTNCASTVIGAVVNGQGALAPGANPCFPNGFPGLPALDTGDPVDAGRAQVLGQVRAGLNDPADVNPDPSILDGLNLLRTRLTSQDATDPGAIAALTTVECALDNTALGPVCDVVRPGEPGMRQGLQQVSDGVPQLVNTIVATVQGAVGKGSDAPADGTLRGGMSGLIDGVDLLSSGGSDLLAGLGLLADGANDLADGTGRLDDGANELADGAGAAKDGSAQLADGAGQLANGLGEAADGSGRLADGLGEAAEGAPKLVDGSQRLSDEGTSKLVEAGESTAQEYGQLYATLAAGAERGSTESMAYGAPEGAMGLTAYSFEIQGEDGEGGRNLARGLAGLAVLGAGAGVFALRRVAR